MQNHSEIGFHRNAGGDFKKCGNVQKQCMNYEMIHQQPTQIHCCNEYSKNVEIYRYYSLNVQLDGIMLNTFCPKVHHIEFRYLFHFV